MLWWTLAYVHVSASRFCALEHKCYIFCSDGNFSSSIKSCTFFWPWTQQKAPFHPRWRHKNVLMVHSCLSVSPEQLFLSQRAATSRCRNVERLKGSREPGTSRAFWGQPGRRKAVLMSSSALLSLKTSEHQTLGIKGESTQTTQTCQRVPVLWCHGSQPIRLLRAAFNTVQVCLLSFLLRLGLSDKNCRNFSFLQHDSTQPGAASSSSSSSEGAAASVWSSRHFFDNFPR